MTGPAGETPGTTPAGETPGTTTTEGETPDPKDDLAGLRDALAKEREARRRFEAEAKKNSGAAQKLAAAEEADKTELQRVADRAAAAEARANLAESKLMRQEVAVAKGLPASMWTRLQGDTREELEADAAELLSALKPSGSTGHGASPDTRSRPKENLRPGSAPDAEPEDNDPSKLAALIPRG